MKCPKCGYLGFETSDRCRHCGYDFSLSQTTDTAPELPLRSNEGAGAALADLDLGGPRAIAHDEATLELVRLTQSNVATVTPPDLASAASARATAAAAQRTESEA